MFGCMLTHTYTHTFMQSYKEGSGQYAYVLGHTIVQSDTESLSNTQD